MGVLRSQAIAPKGKSPGVPDDDRPAFAIPIEEKKTFVWIEHHRDLVELAHQMPNTRLVDVCDREADFFEMFDEQRQTPWAPFESLSNYLDPSDSSKTVEGYPAPKRIYVKAIK